MTNSFDISAFIPKFVDENKDRIQKLNYIILSFEKDPSNHDLLKEIMREAHTLKGTARIMGFSDIITLSHKVEEVFVQVKEGRRHCTKRLCDVVFHALDILEKTVEAKLKSTTSVNVDEICRQLEDISHDTDATDTKTDSPKPLISLQGTEGISPHNVFPEEDEIFSDPHPVPFFNKERTEISKEPSEVYEEIPSEKSQQEIKKTIRLGLDKVDTLSNHLIELIMVQMTFHQRYEDLGKLTNHIHQLRQIKTETVTNGKQQTPDKKRLHEIITKWNTLEKYLGEELSRYSAAYESDIVKLNAVTEGIRQQVMSMRMQPVSNVFDLANRLVRDLSRQFHKDAELIISGAEVEMDNVIIGMLKDPFTHLLRNAMYHGIEEPALRVSLGKKKTGTIKLSARQEGGDILLIIEDDGKGIDRKLVKETAIKKGLLNAVKAHALLDEEIYGFILRSGFSTNEIVTDTSGRGVGMDVVKTVVDRLNGSLTIKSSEGQGTQFILKVPATIALINVLMVRVGDMICAIPSTSIEYIAYISRKDIKTLEGKLSIFLKGQTIPLINIAHVFMVKKEEAEETREESIPIILSRSEGKKIGFIVKELLYEKEIVFREFKGYLKRPKYFSGVTTLGTGDVVLIVNIQELIQVGGSTNTTSINNTARAPLQSVKRHAILIAEDSMITAELEKNILTNAGYEVDIAIDGIDALEKLHGKKYHLLVTDVDMPRINGFELTIRVRADKKFKDIPVIIVTSKETNEDKRRGIEAGADAYVVKREFDQSNLLNTIKRLTGE